MGTNYYLKKIDFPEEDHFHWLYGSDDWFTPKIHVGKSSVGWQFLFNGSQVKTYKEWKEVILSAPEEGYKLVDEYEESIEPEEFFQLVEEKQKTRPRKEDYVDFVDDEGYRFLTGYFS